jgi:hypothetical protein
MQPFQLHLLTRNLKTTVPLKATKLRPILALQAYFLDEGNPVDFVKR